MGVYFRTGDRSGVGVSWWFYLLVVAPLQLIGLMVKGFLIMAAAFIALVVIVSRFAHERWQRRRAT